MLQSLRQKKAISKTNQRSRGSTNHLLPTFQSFFVTLSLLRKSSNLWLRRVILTLQMVFSFKKTNEFYCIKAAKFKKSKDVAKGSISPTVIIFFPFFKL